MKNFALKLLKTLAQKIKPGFTLAEILITLGIIGVISAMTLPVLMTKINEQQTISKVKKTYSMLNQAYKLAMLNEGDASNWFNISTAHSSQTATDFVSHLKPYLKISRDCGAVSNSGCLGNSGVTTLLNGQKYAVNYEAASYYKFMLLDGSSFWIRSNKNCGTDAGEPDVCGLIWYDTNGKDLPNQFGRDIFVFFIKPDTIIPHVAADCRLTGGGWGCAKYILQYGNMNYLRN